MLGLGNRLNKSRVYKTFVGEAISYEYLASGSFAYGGYVISHNPTNSSGQIVDESTATHLTYSIAYPTAVDFGGSSNKRTVRFSAIFVDGAGAVEPLSYVFEDAEGVITEYSDYRLASPGELEDWADSVYPGSTGYHEGNSENPYISVRPTYYNPWKANDFPVVLEEGEDSFKLHFTDGSDYISPSLDQVNNFSYYVLPVRTETVAIQFATPTEPPSTEPTPTAPSPVPFQQRSSSDLTSGATDSTSSEDDQVLDLSVNGDLLTSGSGVNFYLHKPAQIPSEANSDERFKIQFKVEWLVNSAEDLGNIPDPWGPSNEEQKYVKVSMAKLGWKDRPFVDVQNITSSDFALFGGFFEFADYIGSIENNVRVDLHKITSADLDDSPGNVNAALGNGFWTDLTNVYFGYVGYLDIRDFSAKFLTESYTTLKVKDLLDDLNFVATTPDWKKFFMLRVTEVRYGTDQRPESDRVVFPQNLKYILFPVVAPSQMSAFYDYIAASDTALQNFVASLFTGQSQNEPPLIDGSNEDYYN